MKLSNTKYSYINSAKIILDKFNNSIINKNMLLLILYVKYVNVDDIRFKPITKSISPSTNKLNKVNKKLFK